MVGVHLHHPNPEAAMMVGVPKPVALLLALGLLLPSSGAAGVIEFGSDATVAVSAMNADGSIGSPIGLAQCYNHPTPPGYPGTFPACPIWLPGFTGTTPSDLVGGYFTTQLDIPGAPTAGTVSVAVDDFAEVIMNGVVVGSTGSITDLGAAALAQSHFVTFDLSPFLQAGHNILQLRAQNGPYWFSGAGCNPCGFAGNPAGLLYGGSVAYDAATPTRTHSWGNLKSIYR
jgi:hypothetical protein